MAMDFSKQLTSLVCFVVITHQVGTVALQGPQQQSLCCLFFCFCKVFPGLFAKLFELRGTRTTLALGVCIILSGPKLGQMPVVFISSPVIALRSLPTDPTDTKLYCSVLIMQKTTLTVTPHPCLCSKLSEQHKKRAALGWMKQRDLMEISSKVFSYVYMEEKHPAEHTVGCGVQDPGLFQHCLCLWDIPAEPWREPARTVHLPEEPPGTPTGAKHLPANSSGVSTLSIACKVLAKSSK